MKTQSNSIKKTMLMRDKTIALYLRISRDDKNADESNSITNQKKLLTAHAKKIGFIKTLLFIDDGITGTRRDRKNFNRMIEQLEEGHIGAVAVKDLSRLGRDHIRMDMFIEEFCPEHEVRFISIGDGIDTAEGEDEFIALRNWVNERYARDISKKRRLANQVKGNEGKPLSPPPYGYTKSPDNPNVWIVEENAAAVVRKIFSWTLDGYGTNQIAVMLDKEGILTPQHYWITKGINRSGQIKSPPTHWHHSTVGTILATQEYCGDVINFKTYSKSYKHKKRIANSEEDMAIFLDVHEPIIERATFEKVQSMRAQKVKRRKKSDKNADVGRSIFSGMLKCADCGANMTFHFRQQNPDIKYFICANNNSTRKTCPTTHTIRLDFLESVVLGEIKRLTKFARQHEDYFVRMIAGKSMETLNAQRKQKEIELEKLLIRDRELDTLFNRMYEDNVAGKIDDRRFARMSKSYTDEQVVITEKAKVLQARLEKEESKTISIDMFVKAVRSYTRAQKLNERILNELIDRIEVYHAEQENGVKTQKLNIHYNCVGYVVIPEELEIPNLDITINTRKGVNLTYEPATDEKTPLDEAV